MGIRNKGIKRPIVTYYKPIQALFPDGIYWAVGVQTSASAAGSVFTEHGSSGIVGWQFIAEGDIVCGIGRPFKELDYNYPIEVSVLATSDSATGDAPIYKLGFDAITIGSTLPTMMTTLTTMTDLTMGGASVVATPVWTTLGANVLKRDTTYLWGIEFHDDGGSSTTEIYTFGLLYRGVNNVTGETN
jgi:hypothetical protein